MRANGSVLVEPGFMAVYQEGKDDSKDDDGDRLLPEIEEGDTIKLEELRPEQHFTEPPPRFSPSRSAHSTSMRRAATVRPSASARSVELAASAPTSTIGLVKRRGRRRGERVAAG